MAFMQTDPDTVISPGEDEQLKEKTKAMYTAIAQLTGIEKALVMLYLEDRSYEEMETILGVNQNNLRVKMNRVKEKLRTFTKENGYGTG